MECMVPSSALNKDFCLLKFADINCLNKNEKAYEKSKQVRNFHTELSFHMLYLVANKKDFQQRTNLVQHRENFF